MRLLLLLAALVLLYGLFHAGVVIGRKSVRKNAAINSLDASFAPILEHSRALTRLNPVSDSVQFFLQQDFLKIAIEEYEDARRKELSA